MHHQVPIMAAEEASNLGQSTQFTGSGSCPYFELLRGGNQLAVIKVIIGEMSVDGLVSHCQVCHLENARALHSGMCGITRCIAQVCNVIPLKTRVS